MMNININSERNKIIPQSMYEEVKKSLKPGDVFLKILN